jgi:rhodanese-related sulfurtransferase
MKSILRVTLPACAAAAMILAAPVAWHPDLPDGAGAASILAGLAPAKAVAAQADLPAAVSPEELAKLAAKPPAGLEIVDIRPASEFAGYALPGSLNIDAAAVLADESFAAGQGPLVLVDKDGTRAFVLAGALSRKSSRQVLVLRGGLEGWWAAMELGMAVKETPLGDAPGPVPAAPAAAPSGAPGSAPGQGATPPAGSAPAAPAAPAPQPPTSKNAGC